MVIKSVRKARNKFRNYSRIVSNALAIIKLRKQQRNGPEAFVIVSGFHQGRYGFQVIKYLQLAGYQVCFFNSNRFLLNLHQYDLYIFNIPGVCIVDEAEVKNGNENDLIVMINATYDPPKGFKGKIIVADFNVFAQPKQNAIRLPYYVHPNMYENLESARNKPLNKRGRILFYGSSDVSYDKDLINDHFKLLSRGEVFDILNISDLKLIRPKTYEQFGSLLENDVNASGIYFIDGNDFRIPVDEWLIILRQFNFFLATPGMFMPMCHNVIEAMAVGVIPILQYGNHFHPPLTDSVNCISFESAASLTERLQTVLKLEENEIGSLGKGVKDYFNEFISPLNFRDRLSSMAQQNLKLYINAEEYSLHQLILQKPDDQ